MERLVGWLLTETRSAKHAKEEVELKVVRENVWTAMEQVYVLNSAKSDLV
jgi:hypothetical protein